MTDANYKIVGIDRTSLRSNSRKVIGALTQIALGVGLLLWVTTQTNLSIDRIAQTISQAAILPLITAVMCFFLSMIFKAFQYRVLLPSTVPYTYLAGIALTQNALLTFLPWRVGEISFPLLLNRDYGISITSGVSAILLVRFIDLLIVSGVALVSIPKLGFNIGWEGLVFGTAIVAAVVAVATITRRIHALGAFLNSFVIALGPLRDHLRTSQVFFLSLAVFILTTLQATLALRSMGLLIAFTDTAILNAVTLVAAILPIHPPGGWGTMDSIQIAILQNLDYKPELSAPVILATHGFYSLLVLAGGLIGWLIRGRTGRR
jgi:hypothetical protein